MSLSISQVAELCGVSEDTLRSWERRYQLPSPARESNGYRSYSDAQAAGLRQMARLVRVGVAPRHAARYVQGDHAALHPAPPAEFVRQLRSQPWGDDRLSTELQVALNSVDLAQMADDWLLPMLRLVGEQWACGELGVDQEHALSAAVLGQFSLLRAAACPTRRDLPVLLTGLPAGARHEIGIYAFAVTMQRLGWPVVHLGPDLPADSWVAATQTHRPIAVVTAVPMLADAAAAQQLVTAVGQADPDLPVCLGGSAQDGVNGPGVVRLGHSFVRASVRLDNLLLERAATRSHA